jgi:hypothetical protein
MWMNSNVSSNKYFCKIIIEFNQKKLQVTTQNQIQSLSKYTKLCSINDMLKSFDLENNHENLEEDTP